MNAYTFLVGSYAQGASEGIYRLTYDPDGIWEIGRVAELPRASWMEVNGDILFACSEIPLTQGDQGQVCTYRLKQRELELFSSIQDLPCSLAHFSLSSNGDWLMAVSYWHGTAMVFPIKQGKLQPAVDQVFHQGSSVHPIRQTCSHLHSIWQVPGENYVCVCDLGTDEILVYLFDEDTGRLILQEEKTIKTPAGYGVRHLAFSENGSRAYVLAELQYRILTYAYEGAGSFRLLQDQPVGELEAGEDSGAAIRMLRNRIYCSNRGDNQSRIDWLNVDEQGNLTHGGFVSEGCSCPRDFIFTRDGRYLLCTNQNQDSVSIYQIMPCDGSLHFCTQIKGIPSPCKILEI